MNQTKTTQQVQQPTIKHTESAHALYNGVVFVVWAFGIYLLMCGSAKWIRAVTRKD